LIWDPGRVGEGKGLRGVGGVHVMVFVLKIPQKVKKIKMNQFEKIDLG